MEHKEHTLCIVVIKSRATFDQTGVRRVPGMITVALLAL